MKFDKQHIATFLAILFHLCGLIGIMFTPYRDWFIRNTALNLVLMVLLLVWTHKGKNIYFWLFFLAAFLVGMGTEMIGVHTGKLFGSYRYGKVLGPEFNEVPWLIGLNWFVIVFCSAAVMQQVHDWFRSTIGADGFDLPPRIAALSIVIDGALLATFFDWLMEPVAVQLGFWTWLGPEVPLYNYVCWFLISLSLLLLLRWFRFNKANHFAVHLFIIQTLFFLALRTHT